MAFSGSPVIKQVSDRIIRITNVSLDSGQAAAIALHGGTGTTDRLGAASPFALLAKHYINAGAGTTINGDLGYITAPVVDPTVTGATHVNDATYQAAASAVSSVLTALGALGPTFSFSAGNINLSTDATHGDAGTFTPGVYDVTGNMSVDTHSLILNGAGLYVFRSTGTFTVNDTVVCRGGANADDVYWIPQGAASLTAGVALVGNIGLPAQQALSIGNGATWVGRALGALSGGNGSNVTTVANTITTPIGVGAAVQLPATFQAGRGQYDTHPVNLRDLIQCTTKDAATTFVTSKAAIAVEKTGVNVADFLITLTNTSSQNSPLQEIMVKFHD